MVQGLRFSVQDLGTRVECFDIAASCLKQSIAHLRENPVGFWDSWYAFVYWVARINGGKKHTTDSQVSRIFSIYSFLLSSTQIL